jgi:hypothetical protein
MLNSCDFPRQQHAVNLMLIFNMMPSREPTKVDGLNPELTLAS